MKNMKKIQNIIPMDTSEKVMQTIAYVIMVLLSLMAILPCLHLLFKGISSGNAVITGDVLFWPVDPQTETLDYVLNKTPFFNSLKNTLFVTVVGTAISMITTITTAYPLSRPYFKGRGVVTILYVISMVFFGGIIPAYMVIRTIGILDTYWACILPFGIVQFNMFIMKNYFEGLPLEVEESASIDGANDLRILTSIILPMSTPVLATVALLYAINYWNNYFHAMMYTTSSSMRTMQLYLYDILKNSAAIGESLYSTSFEGKNFAENLTTEGISAAAVSMSIIPIILAYPFVQRFMIQGITVGSVKG